MGWTVQGSIPDRGRRFLSSPKCLDQLCGSPNLHFYSLGVKRLWHETDYPPPSSVEVKMGGSVSLLLLYVFIACRYTTLSFTCPTVLSPWHLNCYPHFLIYSGNSVCSWNFMHRIFAENLNFICIHAFVLYLYWLLKNFN